MSERLGLPRPSGRVIAILAIIVVAGAALRAGAFVHHVRIDYDEGRYLDNAVHLLAGDGFATSTISCFFGDPPRPPRPEDVSSPLYPLLLAGIFTLTGPSFLAAKTLSFLLSVAAIPLTYLLGRRLAGDAAGLVAAAALATQPDHAIVGVWAMNEALFMVIIVASILLAAPLALREGRPPGVGRTILLGVACGLLYLVRQNGAAVAASIASLVLLGPLRSGEGRVRRIGLATLVAATAMVVAIPWFYRNAITFGSPTFTRMKNVAWADQGRSLYTPGEGEPTMRTFLEKHGSRALAENIESRVRRVVRETFLAEEGPQRWLAILSIVTPFVPALRPIAAATLPAAGLSAFLLLGVAPWSGALPRYLIPIRPLLYIAGAAGALWLGRRLLARQDAPAVADRQRTAVAAVAVIAVLWAAWAALPTYRGYLRTDQSGPHHTATEVAGWIAASTDPSDVLMEGGYLHQYAYQFRRGVVWTPYGDLQTLLETARRYDAGWLAVTPEVIRFRPGLARHWSAEGRVIRPLDVPSILQPALERGADGVIIYRIAPGSGESGL